MFRFLYTGITTNIRFLENELMKIKKVLMTIEK